MEPPPIPLPRRFRIRVWIYPRGTCQTSATDPKQRMLIAKGPSLPLPDLTIDEFCREILKRSTHIFPDQPLSSISKSQDETGSDLYRQDRVGDIFQDNEIFKVVEGAGIRDSLEPHMRRSMSYAGHAQLVATRSDSVQPYHYVTSKHQFSVIENGGYPRSGSQDDLASSHPDRPIRSRELDTPLNDTLQTQHAGEGLAATEIQEPEVYDSDTEMVSVPSKRENTSNFRNLREQSPVLGMIPEPSFCGSENFHETEPPTLADTFPKPRLSSSNLHNGHEVDVPSGVAESQAFRTPDLPFHDTELSYSERQGSRSKRAATTPDLMSPGSTITGASASSKKLKRPSTINRPKRPWVSASYAYEDYDSISQEGVEIHEDHVRTSSKRVKPSPRKLQGVGLSPDTLSPKKPASVYSSIPFDLHERSSSGTPQQELHNSGNTIYSNIGPLALNDTKMQTREHLHDATLQEKLHIPEAYYAGSIASGQSDSGNVNVEIQETAQRRESERKAQADEIALKQQEKTEALESPRVEDTAASKLQAAAKSKEQADIKANEEANAKAESRAKEVVEAEAKAKEVAEAEATSKAKEVAEAKAKEDVAKEIETAEANRSKSTRDKEGAAVKVARIAKSRKILEVAGKAQHKAEGDAKAASSSKVKADLARQRLDQDRTRQPSAERLAETARVQRKFDEYERMEVDVEQHTLARARKLGTSHSPASAVSEFRGRGDVSSPLSILKTRSSSVQGRVKSAIKRSCTPFLQFERSIGLPPLSQESSQVVTPPSEEDVFYLGANRKQTPQRASAYDLATMGRYTMSESASKGHPLSTNSNQYLTKTKKTHFVPLKTDIDGSITPKLAKEPTPRQNITQTPPSARKPLSKFLKGDDLQLCRTKPEPIYVSSGEERSDDSSDFEITEDPTPSRAKLSHHKPTALFHHTKLEHNRTSKMTDSLFLKSALTPGRESAPNFQIGQNGSRFITTPCKSVATGFGSLHHKNNDDDGMAVNTRSAMDNSQSTARSLIGRSIPKEHKERVDRIVSGRRLSTSSKVDQNSGIQDELDYQLLHEVRQHTLDADGRPVLNKPVPHDEQSKKRPQNTTGDLDVELRPKGPTKGKTISPDGRANRVNKLPAADDTAEMFSTTEESSSDEDSEDSSEDNSEDDHAVAQRPSGEIKLQQNTKEQQMDGIRNELFGDISKFGLLQSASAQNKRSSSGEKGKSTDWGYVCRTFHILKSNTTRNRGI